MEKPPEILFDTIAEGKQKSPLTLMHMKLMSVEETENRGAGLEIQYSFAATLFGNLFVASTATGICQMSFADSQLEALESLEKSFPNAQQLEKTNAMHIKVCKIFSEGLGGLSPILLHVKGSAFQLKVWEALLKIPVGRLTSYGSIANYIGHPKACRAVGTAVGANPIAFLIPCHRVVPASGGLGQYRWGSACKASLINWEQQFYGKAF